MCLADFILKDFFFFFTDEKLVYKDQIIFIL